MENTIVQLSKYVITFLMICFTVQSFAALKERDEDERHYILMRQIIMIILMNFICFFVMFLQEGEVSTIQMFLLTMAYILGVQILYRLIYRKASMILVNNMCMLLSISMIILTRLSVSKAMSQYKILAASTLLCFIIPVIVRKGKFLKNLTWIYAVLGIAMLSVVMVLGFTSGGAKLSIEIHGITFQLSEIAKITLVFFMAGMLREDNSFGNVVKATVIAAVHVLILLYGVRGCNLCGNEKSQISAFGTCGNECRLRCGVFPVFPCTEPCGTLAGSDRKLGYQQPVSTGTLRHVLRRMVRNRPFRGTA